MDEHRFKKAIFESVRDRLIAQSQSLELFFDHWHGTASGIEGWLKVEFTAAIAPGLAKIETGGAGGRGRKGTFPDLLLKRPLHKTIPVELKASGNWYCGGSVQNVQQKYGDCLLAFLTVSDDPISSRHERIIGALDANAQWSRICAVHFNGMPKTFYFVLADLRKMESYPVHNV